MYKQFKKTNRKCKKNINKLIENVKKNIKKRWWKIKKIKKT